MSIRPSRIVVLVGLLALGACAAQSDLADRSTPVRPTSISVTTPPITPSSLPSSEPSSLPSSLPSMTSDEQLIKAARGLGKEYPTASLDEQVSALSTIK